MHNRERHFAMLEDNRIVRPFEWGLDWIPDHGHATGAAAASSKRPAR